MFDYKNLMETDDPIQSLDALSKKYAVMADYAYRQCFAEVPEERRTAFDPEFNHYLVIYRSSEMAIGLIKSLQEELRRLAAVRTDKENGGSK